MAVQAGCPRAVGLPSGLRGPRSTGASLPLLGLCLQGSHWQVTRCCFGCSSASASALCRRFLPKKKRVSQAPLGIQGQLQACSPRCLPTARHAGGSPAPLCSRGVTRKQLPQGGIPWGTPCAWAISSCPTWDQHFTLCWDWQLTGPGLVQHSTAWHSMAWNSTRFSMAQHSLGTPHCPDAAGCHSWRPALGLHPWPPRSPRPVWQDARDTKS